MLLLLPALSAVTVGKSIDLSSNHMPWPMAYYIALALCASAGVMFASRRYLAKDTLLKRITLYIGRNTLIILLLHMFFIALSSHYIKPHIPSYPVYKIIEQTVIWTLLIPSIRIINAKAPWLTGKKKK